MAVRNRVPNRRAPVTALVYARAEEDALDGIPDEPADVGDIWLHLFLDYHNVIDVMTRRDPGEMLEWFPRLRTATFWADRVRIWMLSYRPSQEGQEMTLAALRCVSAR